MERFILPGCDPRNFTEVSLESGGGERPDARLVVTDLTIYISASTSPSGCKLDPRIWHRVEKELFLYTSEQHAWLYVALANAEKLTAEDLFVTDVRVGEQPPNLSLNHRWDSRPCGIWLLRSKFSSMCDQAVTHVDILFGMDAVDPRPRWTLMPSPLELDAPSNTPPARLSIFRGRGQRRPDNRADLRVGENGKFKIVQFSDTHMGVGPGICKDAIDIDGNYLAESEADPLTVNFIRSVLDVERPDLVILTGDQLHHDISDSQSALLKLLAPIIERSIPFAVVFGNHDSEGIHALSRSAQMSILEDLPFSLCEPGPTDIDGIGNYYLRVLARAPAQLPLSTLFFLDSHGQVPNKTIKPDYEAIKQTQIDWFVNTSQAQRSEREKHDDNSFIHLSLAFIHIPVPEFGDARLSIRKGQRREPTESPSVNSNFYDALVKEGVSALGCGHDHVNDFCALLPHDAQLNGDSPQPGPWLCYGGGSGFRGYGSYDGKRYHRRTRVWHLDPEAGSLETWIRVEYNQNEVDKLVLVDGGVVVN